MDYRFLANKGLDRFFEETDLSLGDILRTITSEKSTGIKIENRSRFQELTDKEWNDIIEESFEFVQEVEADEEELKEVATKMLNNE